MQNYSSPEIDSVGISKKKFYKNLISFAIVGTIIFILLRGLIRDWQSLTEFDFQFNTLNLVVGSVLSGTAIFSFSLIWRRIMQFLQPQKNISVSNAARIYLYSQFGKYIPGKAWGYLGLVYLGKNQGFDKNPLLASIIYEIVLSVVSIFLLPLIIFSFYPVVSGFDYGFLPFLPIGGALILIHPLILNYFFRLASRYLKAAEMPKEYFLSFIQIAEIFLYNLFFMALNGIGFFFFVRAFVSVSFSDILIFSGFFIFSAALGLVAVFAPAGLGVREGFLTYFLKFYLPQSLSIFLSLAARVWTTLMEILLLGLVVLFDRLMKKKPFDI